MSRFLAWHRMPVPLADGTTAPLRSVLADAWWFYVVNGPFLNWWYGMVARVADRLATDRMQHLAFLAGFDFAQGFGKPGGILSYLNEYGVGGDIAIGMEHASGADLARLREEYALERSRWARSQRSPVRSS